MMRVMVKKDKLAECIVVECTWLCNYDLLDNSERKF